MAINFDNALGIHQHTLGVRSQRAEVLASNMANADTPNYKARDIDFQTALSRAQSNQSGRQSLARTNERHIAMSSEMTPEMKFRVPNQPDTGDGNTVDVQAERNNYLQNSLEYQASVQFLGSKFKGLTKALKGE
ncbi:flagellar basal body rod protein FlgB [Echinimonas agarilytica]|uniref:Flagellar basal body rod protein FlgB n=1 Tax=Echinimonas agarilytica TaxID=1215918 RepID=A0AA41W5C7_9GAMM|nr:flagellar basal body rod protein FlgB [Echinimonas agarilytica]MCM2678935.1 flagellar basal body rod protein FlgB [Echinimonas agarilytica]